MSKKGTGGDQSEKTARVPEVLARQVRREVRAELLREVADAARQVPAERTRKFTTATARRLLSLLAAGAGRASACQVAGISARTLTSWLKWGADGRGGFAAFYELFRRAESLGVMALTCKVFEEPSWHSATWMLERRRPQRYGRRNLDARLRLCARLRNAK